MYHSSSVQLLRMWTVEIRHAIKPLRHHQRRSHRLSLKRSHFSTMKMKKTTKIPWIPWIQLCPIPIIVQMWNRAIRWKKNQYQSRIYKLLPIIQMFISFRKRSSFRRFLLLWHFITLILPTTVPSQKNLFWIVFFMYMCVEMLMWWILL